MSEFLELLRTEQSQTLNNVLTQMNLNSEEEQEHLIFNHNFYKSIVVNQPTFDKTFLYYEEMYKPSNYILDSLIPCDSFVDVDAIDSLIETYRQANDNRNLHIVESFMPQTNSIVYGRTSSITGRQKIVSGPQILMLKKEDRRKIFSNNNLYMMDFSALEPCILFQLCGQNQLDYQDLYLSIKDYLGLKHIDRSEIKNTVLRLIYGSSVEHSNLNHQVEATELNKFLSSLGINELKQQLKSDLYSDGCLYNFYGKPIITKQQALDSTFQEYMLINYYIQSTAADLALFLFSSFYKQNRNKIRPLFVIHDALLFASFEPLKQGATKAFSTGKIKVFSKIEKANAA